MFIKIWITKDDDDESCWFNALHPSQLGKSSRVILQKISIYDTFLHTAERRKFLIKEISLAAKISFFNFFQSPSCDWMEGELVEMREWVTWRMETQCKEKFRSERERRRKMSIKFKRDWREFLSPSTWNIELLQMMKKNLGNSPLEIFQFSHRTDVATLHLRVGDLPEFTTLFIIYPTTWIPCRWVLRADEITLTTDNDNIR